MKTILITGTSRGIGHYLANYYLDRGYKVIGCSRSNSNIDNSNFTGFCLDITDEKAVKDMFSTVDSLDVLINNAGIASMNSALLASTNRVREITEVNFIATFMMCREAVKIMMRQNTPGRIINFSTIAVPLSLHGEAAYAGSKAAVESFTKVLSKEIAKFNITANVIGPCAMDTDLLRNVPTHKVEKILELQSISAYAEFDDVTNVIDFFIDTKSKMITGQVIYLGGIV
jgi:3-oxoacyl-[acyl-carrier protein] reductase